MLQIVKLVFFLFQPLERNHSIWVRYLDFFQNYPMAVKSHAKKRERFLQNLS